MGKISGFDEACVLDSAIRSHERRIPVGGTLRGTLRATCPLSHSSLTRECRSLPGGSDWRLFSHPDPGMPAALCDGTGRRRPCHVSVSKSGANEMGSVLLRAVRSLAACALAAAAVAHAAPSAGEPLVPLPPAPSLDPTKVALGARLFADRRFAKDNSLACATC